MTHWSSVHALQACSNIQDPQTLALALAEVANQLERDFESIHAEMQELRMRIQELQAERGGGIPPGGLIRR